MSDILMGADLTGRAEFYWVGEKRDLYWGNQHYSVSGEGYVNHHG